MLYEILLFIITGTIAFLATTIKKSLITFENKFKNNEIANQNILRYNIVNIYYQYHKKKRIPFYQKEVVNNCNEAYKKNGGNSFIDNLVKEINEWEVEE